MHGLALFLLLSLFKRWFVPGLVAWTSALVVASLAVQQTLDTRLPAELDGLQCQVQGQILNLPKPGRFSQRFSFRVDTALACSALQLPLSVEVSDFSQLQVQAGEYWRLMLRIGAPRGSANPGGFDYEAWLMRRGIAATAYVLDHPENQNLGSVQTTGVDLGSRIQKVRRHIQLWLDQQLHYVGIAGYAKALLIGETAGLNSDDWSLLGRTGTQHLIIISGLHLSLVVGGSFFLARVVLTRKLAVILAVTLGLGYSLLAGFGLPVQRALIMSLTGLLAFQWGRQVSVFRVYGLALIFVVAANLFAFMQPGFWLSFGIVAALLLHFSGRYVQPGLIPSWVVLQVRSQAVAFVGLVPWIALTVRQLALISPLVNLVAIPWVGLVIVPSLLSAVLIYLSGVAALQGVASFLLHYGGVHLELLKLWLLTMASSGWQVWLPDLTSLQWCGVAVGVLLLLTPLAMQQRWLSMVLLLPLSNLNVPAPPALGSLRLTAFDVGQGTAVLVQTSRHALMYDAGPAYGDADAGSRIVLPALRSLAVSQVHRLIISHGDLDHAGGMRSLREAFPLATLHGTDHQGNGGCDAPVNWRWDGIEFVLFNISRYLDVSLNENDRSCILLILYGNQLLLLPGDISAQVEQVLVRMLPADVDLMLAPHHGSLSSSSPALLNRSTGAIILVTAGNPRRFGHPHPAVLARYHRRQALVLNTWKLGAVTVTLDSSGFRIQCYRIAYPRFWYDGHHAHPNCQP